MPPSATQRPDLLNHGEQKGGGQTEGPLPDSGLHVGRSRTTRVLYAVRAFMDNNDPKPSVALIKKSLKIYPYTPGGFGTSIATALEGKTRLEANPPVPPTKFIEASGKSFNTIPPNDFSYFEMINELVQQEPPTSADPVLMGQLAAIGIVHGKPFSPDARMRKILTEAQPWAIPPTIPAKNFWSFTVCDNQIRSMLETPQRYPWAGSQSYPTPAAVANADGSTTVYFAPKKPGDVTEGNRIQTVPGKGWFTILRLYGPLESFFTKEWRPSEIELVP